jgi:hypothetical protein
MEKDSFEQLEAFFHLGSKNLADLQRFFSSFALLSLK